MKTVKKKITKKKIVIAANTRYLVFKCLWNFRDAHHSFARHMWKERLSNVCTQEEFKLLKKAFKKLPADSNYHRIFELKEELPYMLEELENLFDDLGLEYDNSDMWDY